jgi:hypothetical protein
MHRHHTRPLLRTREDVKQTGGGKKDLSVPWSPIFLSGPPHRPWPAYQTGTRFLSPVAFICFRTGAKRCYKKALTSNGSSRIDNQGLLGKPGFRHWASENFGSVGARSQQGVAGRGFFSFRRWLDPRSARPDTDPSWPPSLLRTGPYPCSGS